MSDPDAQARATWPSSWMATAAGPSAATARARSAIAPARAPCRSASISAWSEGIEALTLFAFSSENWNRPDGGSRRADEAVPAHARPRSRRTAPPRRAHPFHRRARRVSARRSRKSMDTAEALTARQPRDQHLTIAASYGGRWDIVQRREAAGRGGGRGPASLPRQIDEAAVREPAVAGRPARAGPVHPHRRRPAHQQFPALAARLYRTVVHRNAVAGPGCGDTAPGPG